MLKKGGNIDLARPTIRDVAKKAGYSVTAVSLVLNQKEARISDVAKEKILAVAKEMNYRQNRLAVDMIRKKTMVLGLIIPDNSNMFFAELSRSIESAASQAEYNVIYGNTNNNPHKDYEYICMFSDRQVDGIIFARSARISKEEEEKLLKLIEDTNIPFVWVDREINGTDNKSGCVVLDHELGGYLAGEHLTKLGHTRIGCFTGPAGLENSNKRLLGFKRAMEHAGLTYGDDMLFEGDYQTGKGDEALEFFINRKVSAVFAFNDLMAIDLYRSAHKMNIKIPEDLSIVGFDNIPFSDLILPPLTTINQPVREMGKSVVETMLEIIEKKDQDKTEYRKVFEPKLIVRGSTIEAGVK